MSKNGRQEITSQKSYKARVKLKQKKKKKKGRDQYKGWKQSKKKMEQSGLENYILLDYLYILFSFN